LFESLPQDERDAILNSKHLNKTTSKDKRKPIASNSPVVDLTGELKSSPSQTSKQPKEQVDNGEANKVNDFLSP